jgi:phage terminase large subunit-like protein
VLECQQWKVRNVRTGSELTIISADTASSWGLLVDFVVADEVCHWRNEDLWVSLLSAVAKKEAAVMVVIANAGFQESWQWPLREKIRADAGWYFSRLDGPRASWIAADRLAEQRRLLPSIAFDRLWGNVWSSGAGDALEADLIEAALTQAGPMAGAELGWVFAAGLDLGLSRDASALVLVGRHVGWCERVEREKPVRPAGVEAMVELGLMDAAEAEAEEVWHAATGRTRLAGVRVWRPAAGRKVELEEVESEVVRAHERFALRAVAYDPWQGAYLAERLAKRGIAAVPVDPVPGNLREMATATLELFRERQVDLYREGDLLADLRALRVVERQYGFRLDSPRDARGHGDAASAFVLAALAARRMRGGPAVLQGPLLVA